MKQALDDLQPSTRKWVNAIKREFVIESYHERLLLLAAIAWDRARDARKLIKTDGQVILDRFGCPKQHPAVQTENQAMLSFSKLLREIGLDLSENGPTDSRPKTRPGGYR